MLGQTDTKAKRSIHLTSALLVGGALILTPALAAADPPGETRPPGNNGTIKVDAIPLADTHPDNEPHVGCVFEIDWYGYDEGDLYSSVTFAAQPPTGDTVILEETGIFIGEDDNSGGGSEAGHDQSRSYDLTDELAAFEPHPQQGYHVKLTVHADGSQGADVKHKVFWIDSCETVTSTTVTETTQTTATTVASTVTTASSTTVTTASSTTLAPIVLPSVVTTEGGTDDTTDDTVAGVAVERAGRSTPVASELARTGSEVEWLVTLAGALSLSGAALTAVARRRRAEHVS